MARTRVGLGEIRHGRGYTQATLAAALGVTPDTVWRWEVGKTTPGAEMLPMVCRLLGLTHEELTAALRESRAAADAKRRQREAQAAQPHQLAQRQHEGAPWRQVPGHHHLSSASATLPGHPLLAAGTARVDEWVANLREQWHLLVKTDNLFGPRHALRDVHDRLDLIGHLLTLTRGDLRREVAGLAAQYAESAAWLHEDAGEIDSAGEWANRAMGWAHEAGDRVMLAWTLFRRSQQAAANRDAGATIGLAHAAQRDDAALSGPMRAALLQQEAHGYALDGDNGMAMQKLDEALAWAATDTTGDARSGHGSFCTESYLELQRASCWLTLRQPRRAVEVFDRTLPTLPAVYRRDRGVALGRFAAACVAIGEPEHAATLAHEALSIARSAGSDRAEREVQAVGYRLESCRHMEPVAKLLGDLTLAGTF